jgi:hypothetical protein
MKVDWRKVALYGTNMVVESCWLYALLSLLNIQAANEQLSILGILVIYPLAFGFHKLIHRLSWHKIWHDIISWLAWAIVMLVIVKTQLFGDLGWLNPDWIMSLPLAIPQLIYTFKPELLIFISSAIIWWLGIWLAYRSVNFTTSVTEFQFGLLVLVIIFAITSTLKIDLPNSITITLAFFFFALLGISIAHAQEGRSWLNGTNRFQWSWLLLASIVLILVIGLIISSVVSPDLLQMAINAVIWLGELVMKVLVFIASLFPRQEPTTLLPPELNMPLMEPKENGPIWSIPEVVRSWLGIGMGILWGGLIVLALWRISSQIYNWLINRSSGSAGTKIEPLKGAFGAELINLLKRILHWLSKSKLLSWLIKRPESFPPEAISVHQIYRHLLRWGSAGGYPRQISQTPNEYLGTIVDLLPQFQADLSFITQQYVTTRYGTSIPTTIELHELKQSWKRVKQNRLKRRTH